MKSWSFWSAPFTTQTDSHTALINLNSWVTNSDIDLITNLISMRWLFAESDMKPSTSLNMLMSLILNQNMNFGILPILWSICKAKIFRHCLVFFIFCKISSVQNEKLATQADQKWTPRWAWNEMLADFSTLYQFIFSRRNLDDQWNLTFCTVTSKIVWQSTKVVFSKHHIFPYEKFSCHLEPYSLMKSLTRWNLLCLKTLNVVDPDFPSWIDGTRWIE